MTASSGLLRRLAKLSGREYGLLLELADNSLLELVPVEGLLKGVISDRMSLAKQYLEFARTIPLDSEFHARQVISRGYYAMHHAARAVIFATRWEDVTSHERVIKEIGRRLGQELAGVLEKQLNLRNDVEYEVYLRVDIVEMAKGTLGVASEFIEECEAYLARRWSDVVSQ